MTYSREMRRFLSIIGVILIGTLGGLLLMEGSMRLFGIGYPLFTQSDEWTGFALRPGASGWQTDEGKAFVQINSAGMRDVEHDVRKPADTIRIAILGDSFAEARQVDITETFAASMDENLKQCFLLQGKDVEILNFGVSGFGTTQEFLQLQSRVWQYEPDIVLLAFTPGNDVRNNSAVLEGHAAGKPYATLKNGNIQVDFSFRDSPEFQRRESAIFRMQEWIVTHSRVAQLLNRVRSLLKSSPETAETGPKKTDDDGVAGNEAGIENGVYLEPSTPEWKEAWTITEQLIRMMHAETASKGAKFLVVTTSTGIQVHPDPNVRQQFIQDIGAQDLHYPDRRLAMLGAREGFTVRMLAPEFADMAGKHHAFYHGFPNTAPGTGHWNQQGHWEAGKIISRVLCNGGFFE